MRFCWGARVVLIATALAVLGVGVAVAAEGDPDPGFNGGQPLVFPASNSSSSIQVIALARQSDGKLVVALHNTSSSPGITVERLTSAGAPDSSFGTNGILTPSLPSGSYIGAMLIQPSDQKIVIGVTTRSGSVSGAEFIRFNTDGTPDSLFGSGGNAFVSRSGLNPLGVSGLAVASDGTLYMSGYGYESSAQVGLIASVSATGVANAWASGGILVPDTTAAGPSASFSAVAVTSGNVFFAGEIDDASHSRYGLLGGVDASGNLLNGFGSRGLVKLPVNTALNGLLAAADGKLKATGFAVPNGGGGTGALIASFSTAGSNPADTGFGSGGQVIVGGGSDQPNNGNAVTEASGYLFVAATSILASGNTALSLVGVDEKTGALDAALGSGGFRNYPVGGQSYATSIADDPSKVEIGGETAQSAGGNDSGTVSQYDVGGFGTVSCNVKVTDSGVNGSSVRTATAFNGQFSATGGTAPYTFLISDGALPPGMTLDARGKLTGTAGSPGTYTFTVKATDSGAFVCSGTESVTVTITGFTPITKPPPPVPVGADTFIIHKEICHQEALWALHHAKNDGIISVVADKLEDRYGKIPQSGLDPEIEKQIKDTAKEIAKESSKTLKDGLDVGKKVFKIIGDSTSVVFYLDYYYAEVCAQDPPDMHFKQAAPVRHVPAGPFLSGPPLAAGFTAAANALLANEAAFAAVEPALLLDFERTQGAYTGKSSVYEHLRALDTATLAIREAALIRARARLRAAFVGKLQKFHLRLHLTAAEARQQAAVFNRYGLAGPARALLARLGLSRGHRAVVDRAVAPLRAGSLTLLAELNSRRDAAMDARFATTLDKLADAMNKLAAHTA